MNVGDFVYCKNDLRYKGKNGWDSVKKNHALIVKNFVGGKVVLERFGKVFVVEKEEISKEKWSKD